MQWTQWYGSRQCCFWCPNCLRRFFCCCSPYDKKGRQRYQRLYVNKKPLWFRALCCLCPDCCAYYCWSKKFCAKSGNDGVQKSSGTSSSDSN